MLRILVPSAALRRPLRPTLEIMARIFLFLILFFFGSSVIALGRVVAYEEIGQSHFSSIQKVFTCGSWRVGDVYGEFRVIQVYLYGQDMLFVDLVHPNSNGSELVLKKGHTFSELNNDHAEISLKNINCSQAASNKIHVTGSATSSYDNIERNFSILIDAESGKYVFQ